MTTSLLKHIQAKATSRLVNSSPLAVESLFALKSLSKILEEETEVREQRLLTGNTR